jgi:preprotein translocase subunit SecA
MSDQRKVIFEQRLEWMRDEAVHEIIADMRHAAVEELVAKHVPADADPEQWDIKGLDRAVRDVLTLSVPLRHWVKQDGITARDMRDGIVRFADRWMAGKDDKYGPAAIRQMQRLILLHALDQLWREHLVMLDDLRRTIHWRSYGRRQPLAEYRTEAFALFEVMLRRLDLTVTALSMRVGIIPS